MSDDLGRGQLTWTPERWQEKQSSGSLRAGDSVRERNGDLDKSKGRAMPLEVFFEEFEMAGTDPLTPNRALDLVANIRYEIRMELQRRGTNQISVLGHMYDPKRKDLGPSLTSPLEIGVRPKPEGGATVRVWCNSPKLSPSMLREVVGAAKQKLAPPGRQE